MRIDCHWYWDGDGILEFVLLEQCLVESGQGLAYVPRFNFSNTDCKKDYVWRREAL